jgi:cell division protein FtsB
MIEEWIDILTTGKAWPPYQKQIAKGLVEVMIDLKEQQIDLKEQQTTIEGFKMDKEKLQAKIDELKKGINYFDAGPVELNSRSEYLIKAARKLIK